MSHVAQQPVHQLHMAAAEGSQQSCLAAVVTRLEGGGGALTHSGYGFTHCSVYKVQRVVVACLIESSCIHG